MKKSALCTPSTLVDLENLNGNIRDVQETCARRGKRLVPMTKTHKSSFVAQLQLAAGADGFLVGTILEAEQFAGLNPNSITFAYPFISECNLRRMLAVGQRVPIIVSLDDLETARQYNAFCAEECVVWDYLLIVDVGLHRFGVEPALTGEAVRTIAQSCKHLRFTGISTHPGHVYAASTAEQAAEIGEGEIALLRQARDAVVNAGFACDTVASGSTPTLAAEFESDVITVVRPGNYVFFDTIQTLYGAEQSRCALTVLASVIGKRGDRRWIIDAGSKCLGLDKGAHGNSAVKGYGIVAGRPELTIVSLSEEVGIVESEQPAGLRISDRIEIIPNHSCSAANMTSRAVLCTDDDVVGYYEVDAREGTVLPLDSNIPLIQQLPGTR